MSKNPHRRRTSAPRRVAGWTLTTAIVLVTLFCTAWIAPSLFGFSRYVITGGSMTGTIDKGSVVFEKPTSVEDLEVGDIITYLPPADAGNESLVTHRIIKMEPAEGGGVLFTTKGDANPKPDPWHFKLVDEKQAVVQYSVPHVGWVFIALADRTTRMLIIGIPASLIGLQALSQLFGALRRSEKDDAEITADAGEGTSEEIDPTVTDLLESDRLAVADA
ncbi:signal peptidase I [Nocardioides humilatus]|uniref:signal peptidase I n=1 Tax=Nocardioides humilatus TaxID=2607660 RepID=UPI00165F27FD|nr:signal peptidase I [Nocardioides humilatus]